MRVDLLEPKQIEMIDQEGGKQHDGAPDPEDRKKDTCAEGLLSCPQMAWSLVRETVAEVLSPSDGLILFCGMSIGYEDPAVSYVRTGRAALDETVAFVGG